MGTTGSFVFKWDQPASEVYVTGTFDDWAKSVKLEQKGDSFEKKLDLPLTEDKIYYKFVVDRIWTTDPTAPQEKDGANNVNNVLTPDQLSKSQPSSDKPSSEQPSYTMSGVTPQSTTAQLAGQVPKEPQRDREAPNTGSTDLPGTFPETPGPNEASEFGVNPIPATSGIGNPVNLRPGEKVPDPSTLTDNTINSTVRNDSALSKSAEDSEKTFGVAPLPATSGIGNPIHLQPGEKVPDPSTLTGNTINSTVQDDSTLSKDAEAPEKTFGVAPLPATSGIGNPIHLQPGEKVPDPSTFTSNTIQSTVRTDPESYEKGQGAPQLPNVVTPPNEREAEGGMFSLPEISKNMIPESSLPIGGTTSSTEKDPGFTIQSAGAGTTTAALAASVPKEPRGVPEVIEDSRENKTQSPPTSESTGGAGAATSSLPSRGLPPSVQQSIDEMNKGTAIAPTVPDIVQESISESHQSPEAAGDKGMVQEKRNVEAELLKGTKPDQSTGEPAPATSAALIDSAPAPTASSVQPDTSTPASTTNKPPAKAPTDPRSIPTDTAAAVSEPAAPTSADVPAGTPAAENAKKRDAESRDISPMTRPDGTAAQTQPMVTSGISTGAAPTTSKKATSSKPAAAAATASSAKEATSKDHDKADKAKKRGSGFFGKLKQKFGDKKSA